ncbi:hypothetical protein [Hydrogenophaga sp.]|uniref:hypothetical protein n=1 Tax=Hydrogenophaga sp. TaxID=1904254 RepID=UPI002730536E|nr:hypothetical protein [Hydrogenophaga sp.]MDP2017357.1 hypothetical protein [Hydrogenophaga sp.]MDP3168607.1 hypothetical protein [Hydrogenophaga sp.]MDP3812584.1 hypothetical protein [Hydrogenophaga sp.]
MVRCFIAIFALHFFLSVSAFAFGDAAVTQVVQAHAAAASQAAPAGPQATAQQDPGKAESSVSHALVDEVPDLPDSLPRIATAQRPPVDGGPSIGYRQRTALAPSLDGLLRPPQQAAFTA